MGDLYSCRLFTLPRGNETQGGVQYPILGKIRRKYEEKNCLFDPYHGYSA